MCQVHVYMNGNRTSPHPAGDRVNLDDIFPRQVVDGLEFHAGPEGPVFQDDECGSLLVFSARSGPVTRLKLHVFAFRRSRIDLEVGKDPGDRERESETRD